jgi:hypothetical protein
VVVLKHNIHSEIPLLNRIIASFIFIIQHKIPYSTRIENYRLKNRNSIIKKLKKNLSRNNQPSGHVYEIERVKNIDDKIFVKNYLNKGLPLIFDGEAVGWNCTKKWNMDYFAKEFGDEVFSLIDSKGLVEAEKDKTGDGPVPVLVEKITAAQFVKNAREGLGQYLRFCPIMETHPELADDLDKSWLKKFRRCFLGISYQSFIGPAGRTTPLHSETTAFFYIMADGEKKWVLFSPTAFPLINPIPEGRGYNYSKVTTTKPDLQKYPGFDLLSRYECKLKKGDILFVPAWMWHEVENSTEGWGVSYRFTSLRGFFKHPAFVVVRLFFTNPSFWEIFYYSFFRSDIAKRDKNLLTPKIYLKK